MHHRAAQRASLLGVVLAAACASGPGDRRTVDWELTVPMPAATAAAIAAGALRQALPFADPVRSSRGAPVQQLEAGDFRIAFARGDNGAWLACATHRLTIANSDGGADARNTVRQETLAASECVAAAPAHADCDLVVRRHGDGAIVGGRVPAELLPALENAFQLALDPRAALPGLAEPNLCAFVAHRLHLDARAHDARGERAVARELRQRAGLLGAPSASLHQRLGDEAALTGDTAGARECWWRALAATSDPGLRGSLAARLSTLPASEGRPVAWRHAARDRLHDNDSLGAMSLLHTARRQRGEPVTDYRLLSQVHHHRADEMAAFACALLAREHAGAGDALAAFTAELWRANGTGTAASADRSTTKVLAPAFATPGR